MAKILINNKQYVVNESDNLLSVCLSIGINLPYFCWHPELGSVGVCRQCAVTQYADFTDISGKLIMSCMTPVSDGLIVSTHDNESKMFRKNIIELLMTNHPHDCPVCEEGGSCHLQDMTVMTEHSMRRYRFSKRTHKNQYLGPFITHEMNRCIACYKCVRFYKDYADGIDFGVYGISNNVYFGRIDEGTLQSEYSGNLVEICPTGVFTDKTYSKHYVRKWDMQYSPSICQHCCIGCNISVGERKGIIRKIENRYNSDVNRYFLCDLGRFSYGYSNVDDRPKQLIYRTKKNKKPLFDQDQIIKLVTKHLTNSTKLIGIGSCRASLENNFALQKLVGINNFSVGVLDKEYACTNLIIEILNSRTIHVPSLSEVENYDTIIVLGEDITQTSPRLALSIRQALKKNSQKIALSRNIPDWHFNAVKNISNHFKNKLFLTSIDITKLDDVADICYFSSVQNQISFALELINQLNNSSIISNHFDVSTIKIIKTIVLALLGSKKPLIVSGVHAQSVELIKISFNLAKLLKKLGKNPGLVLLTSHVNSIGTFLLGGVSIDNVIAKALQTKSNVLIVLENDLYRYLPETIIKKLFESSQIIAIDHLNTLTVQHSDFVFPSCNSFESSGTVVNYEGRSQFFFQVYDPCFSNKHIHNLVSWKWLHLIDCIVNQKEKKWFTTKDVIDSIANEYKIFELLSEFSINVFSNIKNQKVARSPHRFSGRTALYADIDIHELKQPEDNDTHFSFSMEGLQQPQHFSDYIPYAWAPGWNSLQASNKYLQMSSNKQKFSNYGLLLFSNDYKKSLPFYSITLSNNYYKKEKFYVVPHYCLFVTEELAQYSPLIKENTICSIVFMNKNEAHNMSLLFGSIVKCKFSDITLILEVRLSTKLQKGQIGLPIGKSNIPLYLIGKEVINFRKI